MSVIDIIVYISAIWIVAYYMLEADEFDNRWVAIGCASLWPIISIVTFAQVICKIMRGGKWTEN